ncbi:DsbC family protein [Novosphingobium kaempferiae]|uniref:DsbC family protein n=1 Tax=Novosphingobium kaempferiae TaxID=2896849 RepID=UPI003084563E
MSAGFLYHTALIAALAATALPARELRAQDVAATQDSPGPEMEKAVDAAQRQLRQTFTNLAFADFAPAPVKGPIFQAVAGGRMLYFAPESEHLLFAAVYDKNGVNLTALAQDASARKRLAAIDPQSALVIGPRDAPKVIEFTDPDCPYCRALDRFWAAKAAEGKVVQRHIYFMSAIHPQAAAKAEHILCSPDPVVAFSALYQGVEPTELLKCPAGARKVTEDANTGRKVGVSGTPTLFIEGRQISGFQQGELEEYLAGHASASLAGP